MQAAVVALGLVACNAFTLVDDSRQPVLSDDIIKAVNGNKASTWTAGRNTRFEAMTLGQARQMMGAKDDNEIAKLPRIQHDEEKRDKERVHCSCFGHHRSSGNRG